MSTISPVATRRGGHIGMLPQGKEHLYGIDLSVHPELRNYPEVFDTALGDRLRHKIPFIGRQAITGFSNEGFGELRSSLFYDMFNPVTKRRENVAICHFVLVEWAAERVGSEVAGSRHTFDYGDVSNLSEPTMEFGVHPLTPGDFALLDQLKAQFIME